MAQPSEIAILFVVLDHGIRLHWSPTSISSDVSISAISTLIPRFSADLGSPIIVLVDGDGVQVSEENIALHNITPVFVRTPSIADYPISPTREPISLTQIEELYLNAQGKTTTERPEFSKPTKRRPTNQMEFINMMRMNKDPLGRGSAPMRQISTQELALHNTEEDAWVALEGHVYDVTRYVRYHPGGIVIMQAAGKDGTSLFKKFHPWVNVAALIGKLQVGDFTGSQNYRLMP